VIANRGPRFGSEAATQITAVDQPADLAFESTIHILNRQPHLPHALTRVTIHHEPEPMTVARITS
jgi:hypothetical protein